MKDLTETRHFVIMALGFIDLSSHMAGSKLPRTPQVRQGEQSMVPGM